MWKAKILILVHIYYRNVNTFYKKLFFVLFFYIENLLDIGNNFLEKRDFEQRRRMDGKWDALCILYDAVEWCT